MNQSFYYVRNSCNLHNGNNYLDFYIDQCISIIIGVSLSKPHHIGSTVKSVCLLACLLDTSKSLYMAESHLSTNQHYIKHYMALHKTHGVLTIAREPLVANHST